MAERCRVEADWYGSPYVLARDGDEWEWALEKERAHVFDSREQAERMTHIHGGHVVLLDQQRSVRGVLGVADRGPRQ